MSAPLHPASEQAMLPLDGPLTRQHIFIAITLALGIFFDSVELVMTNVLATVFSADPSVSKQDVSYLLAALFVGGAIGAPLVGRMADKFGRRPTLLFVIATYALLSFACGLSADIRQLTVFRFLCGMALASLFPLTFTYVAETLPARHRGRFVMLIGGAGALAATATPLFTRAANQWLLFGLEGWRATLLMAGCGGLAVLVLALRLPESPIWLSTKNRKPSSTQSSQAGTGTSEDGFTGRLTLLLALQFLLPISMVGFHALSGVVMQQRGEDLHGSLLYLSVAGLGAPLGSLTASFFVDRFQRQKLYATGSLVLGALMLGFILSKNLVLSMVFGAGFLFTMTIVGSTLSVYASEMFVTARRGLASGLGYAMYRASAALVPIVLLPLLLKEGAPLTFSLMATTTVVSAILVMIFGPRGTAGKILH